MMLRGVLLHSHAHHTLLTDVRKCVMSVSVGVYVRVSGVATYMDERVCSSTIVDELECGVSRCSKAKAIISP